MKTIITSALATVLLLGIWLYLKPENSKADDPVGARAGKAGNALQSVTNTGAATMNNDQDAKLSIISSTGEIINGSVKESMIDDDSAASQGEKKGESLPLDSVEAKGFTTFAEAELARLKVPFSGREPIVTVIGNEAIITYPLPKGQRGGDFIIKLDRHTGKIIDSKIWR